MRAIGSFCVAVVALAAAACGGPGSNGEKLQPVDALPKPSLPPWILSISPTQSAQTLAQIRIIFAKPLAPVEALSGAGPSDVLRHVSIEPALRGHFALLTPRMVGFVAEQALPVGTRVQITLGAGLRDLAGDALDRDVAWTFETDPLSFTSLPQLTADEDGTVPAPVALSPTMRVTANAAVDPASLAKHAFLVAMPDERIALDAKLETQPTPYPGSNATQLFDPALNTWVYDLTPIAPLERGTTYALRIYPGVMPEYGNLGTAAAVTGGVKTYDILTIVPTPQPSPDSGDRFAEGDPVIAFSNPIDPASAKNAVTISPAPASLKNLVYVPSDSSNTIAINPYALDPDRTYTAKVAATVKDVFGQTLGSEKQVTIRTSEFAPGAWAPSGTSVIPVGAPVALNFYATNLPGNSYQAAYARVRPIDLLGDYDASKSLPPYKQWPSQTLRGARRNAQSVVSIPLESVLGGAYGTLAYGFRTALDAPDSTPSLVGIAQLTNLGVFGQWFPSRGLVLVQHLSDGEPVPNASVAIYRLDEEGTIPPQQCATGTTDGSGELDVAGVDVERCEATAPANRAPALGVVVSQGNDVATDTIWEGDGVGRFDVNGGWTSGAPLSCGTIFTDRQLYQPGEEARITGIAYYVKGTSVVPDTNASYRVKLVDPNNKESPLGTVRTDAFGVFSLPVTFSKQQALGYYTIDAKGSNGNDVTGSLRVAEFKPPNFKLTLTLGATSAPAGGTVNAKVAAAYLFGAPLQGGKAHAYVTRDVATVQPKGWDDYWFGPQWFWPDQTPSFDTDVLQRDLALDAQGATSLDVAVPSDLPFPMTYRVDMETSDVSNLSVSDSQSFLALPSDAVIGLGSDALGTAGAPIAIRAIVTDAAGKPVSGRAVRVRLQKMTYVSATQAVEGGENAQQAVKYDTVASADVTSGSKPVTVNLLPTDSGPYRVYANFAGARGDASATMTQVFVFGAGEADWGLSDPNAVAVKLDKKQYAIGDTATALIGSPYANADVYLAVVRNDAIYRTTLRGVHGAVHATFKITPEMLPNAAVEAVVVRRGVTSRVTPNSSRVTLSGVEGTLALTGMAGFTVDLAGRYLKLSIAPRNATVSPGGAQRVDFTLRGRDGAAAPGELVAMVVNDAILQLSGYRLPDLVQTVFAAQPIATEFSDNRENVTLKTQTPAAEKGFGYGGGFITGAAKTRVRANFRPLAYYAVLKTDAAGLASASFSMPDDLTTWRVMAVALGNDAAHFATGDASFVSNQPLMAGPLLPQFARPGDRFDLGVSIANQTGAAGPLDLALRLSGVLQFAHGDPRVQRATEQAATGMQAFRFPVVVGTPAPSTFAARAGLGNHGDAFSVPFSASDRSTTDSVIESGATNAGVSIPIALNAGGTLSVTLANSIVPQFVTPSERMMTQDALPFADDAASRLIVASALRKLTGPYKLKLAFDPSAAIASSLQRLLSCQRGDGGFGIFAGAKVSDPWMTAAALDALTFARAHGVAVDAGAISSAAAFMSRSLANPANFKSCTTKWCKAALRFEALWALAALGPPRTDFLADIVAQSKEWDSATQIRLARYLLRAPGWQGQGAAMAARLEQNLYVTGRYAAANQSWQWGWFGSLVAAQSQMLQLLLERHAPVEQLDGAVRALVAQQCKCGWPTSDDTAQALVALSAYAATERLVPGTATASVGDKTIGRATFGSTASSQTFSVPASSLSSNAPLRVTSSHGVHYLVLYTYPVAPNAPGELAAFRVVRTLSDPSRSGSDGVPSPLATMDIQTISQVGVGAGRVFDVGIRAIVDHPVDRVVFEDPLPAGFEAVDMAFRTSLQALVPQSDSWEIDTRQIYRDRVVAYASHLEPGVYDLHYLVRSVTPGTFAWPGARVYLKDAPEEFGRSAGTTLEVTHER